MASFGAMPKITHVALFEIIVSSFNCDIITFMKKKSGKNRKHNRANARFYKRLTLICVEVFALVAIVGVSLVLLQASEQEQVSAQLEEAGVTAELLIGTNVSDRAQDHNTTQEEMDTSRYGAELADEEYCKRNRIYAKATISEEEVVLAFAGDVSFANETEKMNNIEKEYRKEFYAEGQLWYFYKRLGYETFLYCPVDKMVEANYRFAIPDDETILGNIN